MKPETRKETIITRIKTARRFSRRFYVITWRFLRYFSAFIFLFSLFTQTAAFIWAKYSGITYTDDEINLKLFLLGVTICYMVIFNNNFLRHWKLLRLLDAPTQFSLWAVERNYELLQQQKNRR